MPGSQWWGSDGLTAFSGSIRVFIFIAAAAAVVALSVLVRSGGPVFQRTGLDLHYLSWPLMLGGALLLLGNLASWSRRFLPPHLAWPTSAEGEGDEDDEGTSARHWPAAGLPILQGLLIGSGWDGAPLRVVIRGSPLAGDIVGTAGRTGIGFPHSLCCYLRFPGRLGRGSLCSLCGSPCAQGSLARGWRNVHVSRPPPHCAGDWLCHPW